MQCEHLGFGGLSHLGEILKASGCHRPLLVTGQASYETSGARRVVEEALVDFQDPPRFSEFSVNPKLPQAIGGCELLRRERCDAIVAIGGGSVLDMAKIINAVAEAPESAEAIATGRVAIASRLLPMIAVPTTAGTGSEATHFAVVYVDGVKYSLADRRLLPEVAIIDPDLMLGLPAYVTACSGFDALCQAVESSWAVGSNAVSRAFSHAACQLILTNLRRAVADPADKPARLAMAVAANLAGKAIDTSKTTAPHALSYTMTSHHSIPHGHAVALTLGKFFGLQARCPDDLVVDPRGADHLRGVMDDLARLFGVGSPAEMEERWAEEMRACGLECDPAVLGVASRRDREIIVRGVNPERLANHPIRLSREQLTSTLIHASVD